MSIDFDLIVKRAEARVGTTVRDKYTLRRLLGVGGMACVFAATHRNGANVALKILHPEYASIAEIRKRFLREGYVANKIEHPGVLRIADDDNDDVANTVFLVTELLSGESVEAKWERNGQRLPVAEVVSHLDVLLDVLIAAHAAGIVHRDLKPDNLFLTDKGELKVLDFGIARLLDGTGATRSGQILGTPAFMAPEQASGRVSEVDGQTDLWSAGAVAYTLLTGAAVHAAATQAQQMIYAATQEARPVRDLDPAIPPDVASVIDRALSFDKSKRWPDAAAMRGALPGVVGGNVGYAPTPTSRSASAVGNASTPTIIQGSGSGDGG